MICSFNRNNSISLFACRFLLPPKLVLFHISAPGGNSSGLFQPRILLLAGNCRLDPAAGCGADRFYRWTSCRARHHTWPGEGCGVMAYFFYQTALQWGLLSCCLQKRHTSKEECVSVLKKKKRIMNTRRLAVMIWALSVIGTELLQLGWKQFFSVLSTQTELKCTKHDRFDCKTQTPNERLQSSKFIRICSDLLICFQQIHMCVWGGGGRF